MIIKLSFYSLSLFFETYKKSSQSFSKHLAAIFRGMWWRVTSACTHILQKMAASCLPKIRENFISLKKVSRMTISAITCFPVFIKLTKYVTFAKYLTVTLIVVTSWKLGDKIKLYRNVELFLWHSLFLSVLDWLKICSLCFIPGGCSVSKFQDIQVLGGGCIPNTFKAIRNELL